MTTSLVLAALSLAIWIYLILARSGFWLALVRDDTDEWPEPENWPRVVAVMPARNEAAVIAQSLHSLLTQDYPGSFDVIVVDDQSTDGTSGIAARTAAGAQAGHRLTIIPGQPLPAGWAGKVWAMKQGVEHADSLSPPPDYLLFIDADITCAPDTLASLVRRAQAGDLALTSLMAKLRCETWAERAFIPAFVFFFQMLYPFAWVNRSSRKTAAAAGGCMLVNRNALRQAGGIEAIRNALIDDCALARKLKSDRPIWLGLTERVRSLRAYPRIGDILQMVSRSAYHQLRYSPLLLTATIAAIALTYLVPPYFALFGTGVSRICGLLGWAAMALAFQPILRFYRVSPLWGAALPAIGFAYMIFTLHSAYQHRRGRGGLWKGRVHANVSGT